MGISKGKLVAYSLLFSLSAVTVYAKDVSVNKDGVEYVLTTAPITENDHTFIGVRDIFTLLGATLDWNDKTKTVTAKFNDDVIEVTANQKNAKLNGVESEMNVPAKIVGNKMMVPLKSVSEFFGYTVSWNNETKTVNIQAPTEIENANGMIKILNTEILSASGVNVISYDEALSKTLAKNSSLKNLSESVSVLEETRDDTQSDVIAVTLNNRVGVSLIRALENIKIQISNLPLQEKMVKATSEYMLKNSLTTISNANMDVQLLKKNIELNQTNLKNLELKKSLDLASENEVKLAEQNLEQKKLQLGSLELSIKKEKETLNILMGYKVNDEVAVNYTPEFKVYNQDVEKSVAKIATDPSIIVQQGNVQYAQYEVNTSFATDVDIMSGQRPESKLSKQEALAQAERKLADDKSNMEKAIRSTFIQIAGIEKNQELGNLDLQKARDNYNTMLANYKAGMVTQYEVEQTKLGILNAEIALQKNIYNLDNLKYAVENPFLLTLK